MSNVVKAGAAYEATLTDNVTGRVDRIIASLGRLEQAFKGVRDPARDVGRVMDNMGQTMIAANERVKRSTSTLKRMQNAFQNATSVISTASQAIGQSLIHIGNQMRNMGLAATAAAASIAAGFVKAIQVSARYEAAVTGLRAVFRESAEENLKWADSFSLFMGRSPTETIESLKTFRAVLSTLDLPTERLDRMSQSMHTMAVDLAAFADITDQQAITKMMQGLSGSAIDELRKLGLSVSDARVKEFATSIGVATKELTEQQKMLIRYNLIMDQMKNGLGAVGQALRERDSLPNQMKRLRAEVERTALKIGDHFTPIAAKLMGILRSLAEAARSIPLERFEQLAAVMIGLAATGGALIVLGTALAGLGPPIIAFGTVAASVLGATSGLFMMMATGPVGTATAAIIALTGAMAGLATYVFLKNFPVMEAISRMGAALNRIFADIKFAIDAISTAVQTGDWEGAWDIITATGEAAFWDLAVQIRIILSNAIYDAIEEGLNKAETLLQGFMRGLFEDPIARAARKHREAQAKNNKRQENELVKMQNKADEARERARKRSADILDRAPPPRGSGGIMIPMFEKAIDAAEEAAEKVARNIRGTSIGGFGANFARNMGQFGPQMNFVDNQEKQIDLAEEQAKQQANTNTILQNMEPLTMGNG
jgi:hypothetical protein